MGMVAGAILIVAVLPMFKNHNYTGFYYEKVPQEGNPNMLIGQILEHPTHRSAYNQFKTLQDCTNWGYALARDKQRDQNFEVGREDMIYCSRYCGQNNRHGVSAAVCSDDKAELFSVRKD